jgi:hypothetical protein
MIVRVGADVTGLNKGMKQANQTLAGFASKLNKTMAGVQGKLMAGMAGIGGGLIVQSATEDAMKYESLMTTLGESLGNSRKDFEKWSATTGRTMGFSRLQSAELANTLSLNFKKIAGSQEELTNKTTKMMEIAGIVANKRGLGMQEVSDRIRSAMNQEADGADELGVNVRIAAIKTSDAYKQMADGKPWDQLSQHMQKTILYEHIIQQVTENLGATMQDTTQLRMGQFVASLYDVRLALGQAFLPIMYQVLPYLTKLMDGIYKALQYVSAFSRALFGGFKFNPKAQGDQIKQTQKQTDAVGALGDATEKAGKKAKKAGKEAKRGVAGFDEVNLLADPAGAGAGAGGAGGAKGGGVGDIAQPEGPPMQTNAFMEGVDKLAEKMKNFMAPIIAPLKKAWEYISSYLQIKFWGIVGWWKENGDQIVQAFKNIWKAIKPVVKWLVKFIWDSIKGLIDGIIQFFEGFLEFFSGVFTGDWDKAWEGIKDMFFGAVKAILNFFNLYGIGGIKKLLLGLVKDGVKIIAKLVSGFKTQWNSIWTGLKSTATTYLDDAWSMIKGKFDDWVTHLYVVGDDILKAITGKLRAIGTWITDNVITPMKTSFENGKTAVATKAGEIWTSVKSKFSGAYNYIRDNVIYKFRDALKNHIGTISGKASDIWTAIKSKFSGAYDWFKKYFVKPIADLLGGVKNIFKNIITGNFKGAINVVIKGIRKFITALNNIKSKIPYVKNLPDIKQVPYLQLAKGGIATRATMAMVGEGSQPEAIAPIDKLQGYITTAVLSALRFQGGGGGGETGDIVLNIDGRTFARIIKPHLDKEIKRIGGNVKFNSI